MEQEEAGAQNEEETVLPVASAMLVEEEGERQGDIGEQVYVAAPHSCPHSNAMDEN